LNFWNLKKKFLSIIFCTFLSGFFWLCKKSTLEKPITNKHELELTKEIQEKFKSVQDEFESLQKESEKIKKEWSLKQKIFENAEEKFEKQKVSLQEKFKKIEKNSDLNNFSNLFLVQEQSSKAQTEKEFKKIQQRFEKFFYY